MIDIILAVLGIIAVLIPVLIKLFSRKAKKRKEDAAEAVKQEASDRKTQARLRKEARERQESRRLAREAAAKWNPDLPFDFSFKVPGLKGEFEARPERLREAFFTFCLYANHMGITPVITRVAAAVQDSSGVHAAGRAIDIRDQFAGVYTYTVDQRKELLESINSLYPRNDGKLVLIHHSFKADWPEHFHLQIPSDWGLVT